MAATRRLAAILAADVAGYSRLMGADEEGTLERLKALRRELLEPEDRRAPRLSGQASRAGFPEE
jgi:class 3 adenylate cyclase